MAKRLAAAALAVTGTAEHRINENFPVHRISHMLLLAAPQLAARAWSAEEMLPVKVRGL